MRLRIFHIVALCLSLALVLGQIRVVHGAQYSHSFETQMERCHSPGGAPHGGADCADSCPYCQLSMRDAAFIALVFVAALVEHPTPSIPLVSPDLIVPPTHLIVEDHRARAPPLAPVFG